MKCKQPTPQEALVKLETLCSRAEHCTSEMVAKLRNWGIPPHDSDTIIESLKRDRFIDDRRFAHLTTRYRLRQSGYGRRRIAMELAMKKIPADIIKEAIAEEIEPEEYDAILFSLMASRASRIDDLDAWENRNKLYRWALGRGFESDAVIVALKKIIASTR